MSTIRRNSRGTSSGINQYLFRLSESINSNDINSAKRNIKMLKAYVDSLLNENIESTHLAEIRTLIQTINNQGENVQTIIQEISLLRDEINAYYDDKINKLKIKTIRQI